jgi:hypothetical protein
MDKSISDFSISNKGQRKTVRTQVSTRGTDMEFESHELTNVQDARNGCAKERFHT